MKPEYAVQWVVHSVWVVGVLSFLLLTTIQGCSNISFIQPQPGIGDIVQLQVSKDAPNGTQIAVVEAVCLEGNTDAEIRYYLVGQTADKESFSLFDSNILYTAETPTIQRGVGEQYHFSVAASGLNENSQSQEFAQLKFEATVIPGPVFVQLGSIVGTRIWSLDSVIWPDGCLEIETQTSSPFRVSEDCQGILVDANLNGLSVETRLLLSIRDTDISFTLPIILVIGAPKIVAVYCDRGDRDIIVITWISPPTTVHLYRLNIKPLTGNPRSENITSPGNMQTLSKQFSVVHEDDQFDITVQAIDGEVEGAPSETLRYNKSSCTTPCDPNPCQHGGTCEGTGNPAEPVFGWCICPPRYSGIYCDVDLHICDGFTCHNQGTCTVVDNEPHCECAPNFTGIVCEARVVYCTGSPCKNGGSCKVKNNILLCDCEPGYKGDRCENWETCPAETLIDVKGVFNWREIKFSTWDAIPCIDGQFSDNNEPRAHRFCGLTAGGVAQWLTPNISECKVEEFTEETIPSTLQSIIDKPDLADDAEQLSNAAEVLARMTDVVSKNKTLTVHYIETVDKMLTADIESLSAGNTNVKLVASFDEVMDKVDLGEENELKLYLPNMAVEVREREQAALSSGARFEVENETIQEISAIFLPSEVFTSEDRYRLKFVLYNDNKLFPTKSNTSVKNVITASLTNTSVSGLETCIEYRLPKIKSHPTATHTCVFWDEKASVWREEGIQKLADDDEYIICGSSHLTHFGILLDVDPETKIDDLNNQILSIISYVGMGLSIVGLLLTLISYCLFPCLHRDKSGQILIHLAASMITMDIFFVAGARRDLVENQYVCTAIAVVLHFATLSTLMWMAVEAFNLYRMLIKVFAIYEKRFLLKRTLVAWGIPLILVTIGMSVDIDSYIIENADNESCVLSHGNLGVYYGTYIAPACLTLLFNVFVFVVVCKVLLRPKFDNNSGKRTVTKSQIRGVLSVLALLGISWLFVTFAIGAAKVPFLYLFCITSALQGFCIFLFRCLNHPECRAAWHMLFTEGALKSRRGALIKSSLPSHTTSSSAVSVKRSGVNGVRSAFGKEPIKSQDFSNICVQTKPKKQMDSQTVDKPRPSVEAQQNKGYLEAKNEEAVGKKVINEETDDYYINKYRFPKEESDSSEKKVGDGHRLV